MYKEKLKKEDYLSMYRWLYLIRKTEEAMMEINSHTPICELPHSSIGQEAISVGICYGLRREDQLVPSLRTRGGFLMKGISSRTMMGGAFGKDVEPCRGKNTSHHIGDADCGVVSGCGILASHLPVAVGFALAIKQRKEDAVVVACLGDGSCNRGDVHESMNFAAVNDLPIIFVIENNQYAMSTPIKNTSRVAHLADRAAGYGIQGVTVDGNDTLAVYEAAEAAYEKARTGGGPTVLECMTYRWRGHSEKDTRDLRPREEIEMWEQRCPVKAFRELVLTHRILTEAELTEAEEQVNAEVTDAVEFAENGPYPPLELLETNVYEEEVI